MLRRTLGEKIALEVTVGECLWPGLTDANQFENALLNLVINARDAMPDGGRSPSSARNVRLDEPHARTLDNVAPGDYVAVASPTRGIGMPADVLAKAFDPFFTTKPIGQGTGLGLSMIYGFVQAVRRPCPHPERGRAGHHRHTVCSPRAADRQTDRGLRGSGGTARARRKRPGRRGRRRPSGC